MSSKKIINLGILGAANIAPNAVIYPSKLLSDSIKVVAVAARDKKKATQYAEKYGIPKVFDSYEDLIQSKDIDAIYNPLPNGLHAEWTIKALKAGKHVLCEKPFTSNSKEAELVKSYHEKTNLSLVEAFHFRYHPLTKRLKEVIDKDIGKLISIDVEFSLPTYMYYLAFGDNDIRWDYNLGGGISMDAGCYCVNALLHFGGEIKEVLSTKHTLLKEEIDISMDANFELKNGAKAHMYADFKKTSFLPVLLSVNAVGEDGSVYCNNLLGPSYYHYLTFTNKKGESKTEKVYSDGNTTYFYQLKAFCDELNGKEKCETTPKESVEIMKVIDMIYEKSKLKIRPTSKYLLDEQ